LCFPFWAWQFASQWGRTFRIYGLEETLMLFFMLPAIIFFGMCDVFLEPQDSPLQPQCLTDRTNEQS
jgi:hypothetical protein